MGKLVTDSQGLAIAHQGRDMNVGREEWQNAPWGEILRGIRDGLPVTVGVPTVAPPGCRVHTLKVKVRLDQPWGNAINAAGPNTPQGYNVRKVIDLYPPTGAGIVEQNLVLLNYVNGDGSWEKALAWAASLPLKKTAPRSVFAIGAQYPNFHRDVGIDPTYVVATEECTFGGLRRACYVYWLGSDRKANLLSVDYFGLARAWFAFSQV